MLHKISLNSAKFLWKVVKSWHLQNTFQFNLIWFNIMQYLSQLFKLWVFSSNWFTPYFLFICNVLLVILVTVTVITFITGIFVGEINDFIDQLQTRRAQLFGREMRNRFILISSRFLEFLDDLEALKNYWWQLWQLNNNDNLCSGSGKLFVIDNKKLLIVQIGPWNTLSVKSSQKERSHFS